MQESRYFPLAASGPPQALHLPSVYQEEQPPGFAPRSLHFGSLSRFRLYVIIFFFSPFSSRGPNSAVNLCSRTACCSPRASASVCLSVHLM